MGKFLIGLLVFGTCGIVYSLPIAENSTPTFQTVSSSTEKNAKEAHPAITEKNGEKEISPTVLSTTAKLPEHPKSVTEENSTNGLDTTVTTVNKNEATTSQSHKEETTVTPSSHKAEVKESTTLSVGHKGEPVASSSPNHKQEESTTKASDHKVESKNPSATGQKGPTTIKPASDNKEKKSNNIQKTTKTSTAYLDKGKVVIFNGICGPDGCEIEGDVYDELVPLPHAKKHN